MKHGTKLAAGLAIVVAVGATCLGGALGVTLMASGVFSTTEPAWTTQVPVFGRSVTVNVPGVARLLTAPGVAHVLDGRVVRRTDGSTDFPPRRPRARRDLRTVLRCSTRPSRACHWC